MTSSPTAGDRHRRAELDLARRLVAEALGTGLLVIAVIGSGIMASPPFAQRRRPQLLENSAATAGALIGLILIFGAVSGAHFNPVVTLVDRAFGSISTRDTACTSSPRSSVAASAPCRQPDVRAARRRAVHQGSLLGRAVAVRGRRHARPAARDPRLRPHRPGRRRAFAVGAWIAGAYWFTSSTSFANPAVTIARTLSDSFAGIKPSSAPMFIVMQLVGAALAFGSSASSTPDLTGPTDAMTDTSRSPVRLHPQRRPLPDGRRSPRTPRQATASWSAPLAPPRPRTSTPPSSKQWPRSASTSAPQARPPKKWTTNRVQPSDVVITMGCGDECPSTPANATKTGSSTTPPAQRFAEVRTVRDQIDRCVLELLDDLTTSEGAA